MRDTLFGPGDRPGYLTPLVDASGVKSAILDHSEFATFTAKVTAVFEDWRAAQIDRLRGIAIGDKPKDLIAEISEDLLDRFKPVPLINGYDVYQHLMTYWAEVMQDDTYVLVQDGWAEEAARAVEELDEEHGGEDGLRFEAKTDKGKLTAKSLKDRTRDIRTDKDADEERAMLKTCLALIEAEADAAKAVKEAQAELDAVVVAQYAKC